MRRGDRTVRPLRVGTRRELGLMVGFGFLAMLLIGLGAVFASRSVAHGQALEASERITERMANLTVKPVWSGYRSGDPADVAALQEVVARRMLVGDLTEVTVWSADAVVLYSNKSEDIGKHLPRPDHLDDALAGATTSDFEKDQPEADTRASGSPDDGTSVGAGAQNRFVEVYTPFQVDGEPPMVFEAYYSYDRVEQLTSRLLSQTLPLVLGPLLLLQLIQVPIAVSLARRIKRHENERSRLLEQALSAAERERVRFVADLHDGPIQDLAGINFMLGAVAPTLVARHGPAVAGVQDRLQRSMGTLRELMTDLYSPDLGSGNLDRTLHTLADGLRDDGIAVVLDLREIPTLSEAGAVTLYWVAREALTNVQSHAQARTVTVRLSTVEAVRGRAEARVRLVVTDDGVGFDPEELARPAEGRLGLRLLVDRVESLGGQLTIVSAAGQGTSVQAELPVSATRDGEA